MDNAIIVHIMKLPPYDKNGNGTPVSGISPSTPPKFTKTLSNKYQNIP